jgi:hypothetical protein
MNLKEGTRRLALLLELVFAGSILTFGCRSSAPADSSDSGGGASSTSECIGPENPYDEGSGHYAGYEWALNNGSGSCSGHSQSFNEGCEEYESQQAEYDDCEAKKRK